MPGFLIEATCDCGFGTLLKTGSDLETWWKIAYTHNGDDLKTVTYVLTKNEVDEFVYEFRDEDLREEDIEIVEDPFLNDDPWTGPTDEFGGYRCPNCKKMTMRLINFANWD